MWMANSVSGIVAGAAPVHGALVLLLLEKPELILVDFVMGKHVVLVMRAPLVPLQLVRCVLRGGLQPARGEGLGRMLTLRGSLRGALIRLYWLLPTTR